MKIVIPGGSGQVGAFLAGWLRAKGHGVVVLSRVANPPKGIVAWDAKTLGPWAAEIDGADAVINLAGRNVNCRYTQANRREMFDSRVESTRVVGEAIRQAARPPRVWLQASTATIYSHRFDAPNDERTGIIGGSEPDAPTSWGFSIEIAKAWERTQQQADTPKTRKIAARTTLVMSPCPGGIFGALLNLTRFGLGGAIAGGQQYISWIHERDFGRIVELVLENSGFEGPVNVGAPHPLPQREFMAELRKALRMPLGLPAAAWMIEAAAFFLRTESELLLKSRRVVPGRLLEAGFPFEFPDWPAAAKDLVETFRGNRSLDRLTSSW